MLLLFLVLQTRKLRHRKVKELTSNKEDNVSQNTTLNRISPNALLLIDSSAVSP